MPLETAVRISVRDVLVCVLLIQAGKLTCPYVACGPSELPLIGISISIIIQFKWATFDFLDFLTETFG